MRLFWKLFPLLVLIFIGFGDSILPDPLGDWSFKTRSTINGFFLGMFPSDTVDSPYGKNEEIIKQTEQRNSQ